MVHLDNEMTMDPTEYEMEEWNALNERQQEMAEHTAETAMQFGMFKQDSSADGAHYFDGSKNPFKSEGVMCKNCIFFNEDTNQCIVVEGNIDEEGLCKLWIIPEDELSETPQQEAQEETMENVEKRDFSSKQREHLASTGAAMPDGSYPITNRTDLENAIRSWGRGGADPKVKQHIISRARTLGLESMIPDNWKTTSKSLWDGSFDPRGINKIG